MLERRAPLDQVSRTGEARVIEARGLRVAPVADRGLLLLQVDPDDPLTAGAIRGQVGTGLPAPLQAGLAGEHALLWMAPREFLLELPAARASTMQAALAARLGTALTAVTDVSDAFAGFDLDGETAPDALMSGCTLDLRPQAFAAGRVARTALAGVPAIIWKQEEPSRFRCRVDRSYAAHLWEWFECHCGA